MQSIKLELSLFNQNLKQLIYFNLFILNFESGVISYSLTIEVISPDRMITIVLSFYNIVNYLNLIICFFFLS